MALLSISGKIGSGKDTVAEIIKTISPYYNWEVKKFAYKLKVVANILTDIPISNFEDQEFKKTLMSEEWGMTHREFLQRLGTEAMRNGLHQNTWVNALFADYKIDSSNNYPNWIITDTRFINEINAVSERNGIKIKIERDLFLRKGYVIPNESDLHSSETSLDMYTNWDYIIYNNGDFDDLKKQVYNILLDLDLIKFSNL
jgi:dephospho-CoA kinase